MADIQEITNTTPNVVLGFTRSILDHDPRPSPEAVMCALARVAALAVMSASEGPDYALRFFIGRLKHELARKG